MMQNDTNKTTLTLVMPTGLRTFAEYRTVAQGLAAAQLKCSPSDITLEYPEQVKAIASLTVTVRPAGVVVASAVQHARNWQRLCVLAGVLLAVIAAATAWQWRAIAVQQQTLQQQTDTALQGIVVLKKEEDKPKVNMSPDPLRKAQQVAQQDINPYFAALERIQVPQVRLRQLTVDTNAKALQATFDVADTTQVAHITQALNESDKALSWTLKNLSERQATYTANPSKP